MRKGTTMQDIAKAAGVSQSTVSMILNQKTSAFPPETVEKVLSAATALNYNFRKIPQPASCSAVLVISVQPTNPYYTTMLQAIDREAVSRGITVVTSFSYHSPALERSCLKMALDQHFSGIIFLYPPDNRDAFEEVRRQIPIVVICDKASKVPGDCVELNNYEAGTLAAKHLLSLGHTNIAVLAAGIEQESTSRATRVAGIIAEIRKSISEDPLLVLHDSVSWSDILEERSYHYQLGQTLAGSKKLLQKNITGLICVNDMMAYGVMDKLINMGYRIPEDFSIVGSDNLLFSGMAHISLTTVENHPDVVAGWAFVTLLNRTHMLSNNQSASATTRFQVQCEPALIIRGSTGPAGQRTGEEHA